MSSLALKSKANMTFWAKWGSVTFENNESALHGVVNFEWSKKNLLKMCKIVLNSNAWLWFLTKTAKNLWLDWQGREQIKRMPQNLAIMFVMFTTADGYFLKKLMVNNILDIWGEKWKHNLKVASTHKNHSMCNFCKLGKVPGQAVGRTPPAKICVQ